MINEQELIQATKSSPIKKDFYQIYPEILDLVSKITERWDPSTSNESDPGVVLLKLLAFIADKANYNIDKNVLECFMPSATQEDSMRKLCEMMGYEMKYNQSATTEVSFTYLGNELKDGGEIIIPAFETVVTNNAGDITYIITGAVNNIGESDGQDTTITKRGQKVVCTAIEGEYCTCYVGNTDKIQIQNLDDNHRFYLPESSVAENGIYIKSYSNSPTNEYWRKTANLNTERSGQPCYKFGYDSKRRLPYVQFPKDVASLMGDGLQINYIRTRGTNGNIKAFALSQLNSKLKLSKDGEIKDLEEENSYINIINNYAAVNGSDLETLDDAYNNFKKTIGTFDTLVTCRDYANAIYQLLDNNSNPVVSNVQTSDIRDDLNKSYAIATFNAYGTSFKNYAKKVDGKDAIQPFDLYIYAFKPITGAYNEKSYKDSFKLNRNSYGEIKAVLDNEDSFRTLSHQITMLNSGNELAAIKNYLLLNAKITTTRKVTAAEEKSVLANVKEALYRNFNMRKIDWGEEIPFDTILAVIQSADALIKNVSLEEPDTEIRFLDALNKEYSPNGSTETDWEKYYQQIVLKNVLANRVVLFDYDEAFSNRYEEKQILTNPSITTANSNNIARLTPLFKLPVAVDPATQAPAETDYELKANEIIQFSAPNFSTTITFPAYINYYWKPANGTDVVSSNADYALKTGDHLYLNRTDSNGNIWNYDYYVDGDGQARLRINNVEQKVETNKQDGLYHHVIRVTGFENGLQPSNLQEAADKTFTKTSKALPSYWQELINGMYSLDSSQTIEFREAVAIKFEKGANCDWIVNNRKNKLSEEFEEVSDNYCYKYLQTGEYFFYTNADKTDLGILGSGTKLIYEGSKSDLSILLGEANTGSSEESKEDNEKLDADEVANLGLGASFNWRWIEFSGNNYLTAEEVQYLTLTEGDILNSCVLEDSASYYIDSTPRKVSSASYSIVETGENNKPLPEIPFGKWEVSSRLDLDCGPNKNQYIKSVYDYLKFETYNPSTETYTLLTTVNLSSAEIADSTGFKSSQLIQLAGGSFDLPNLENDSEATFRVKFFQEAQAKAGVQENVGGPITIENYTRQSFTAAGDDPTKHIKVISLPINVPTPENFALVMFYYYSDDPTDSLIVWGDIPVGASGQISFYNQPNDSNYQVNLETLSLTVEGETKTIQGLVVPRGMSIIKIPTSCVSLYLDNREHWVRAGGSEIKVNPDATVTFGLPTLIKTSTSNPQGLNLPTLDITATQGNALLESIKSAATTIEVIEIGGTDITLKHNIFYYNSPTDNSKLIDINTKAGDSLKSASSWYDYNNVVNKFVISEIDADVLDTHIQLTKSSKY